MDQKKIETAVKMILEAIGEDPRREGLRETPARVARMCLELFSGLGEDPQKHLCKMFSEEHDEMVIVKNIPFHSVCEHHLLPFYGAAHIAYIPKKGKVTGLSKLVRVMEGYAKRPQLQERLASQIADAIVKGLAPHGVMVVLEAEHMCMAMRGVHKPGSRAITSAVRGLFERSKATRAEALSLIKQ